MGIKMVTLSELTQRPYAGNFLMYQLFEESSTIDEGMIAKTMKNVTDYDLI